MLLDEYGGQNNGKRQDAGAYGNQLPASERLVVHYGKVGPDGIIYMDTGPKVRGSIGFPEGRDQGSENIVPGHLGKPQVMAVGKKGGYDQEDGHTRKQESACFIVVCFILEKEKDNYG